MPTAIAENSVPVQMLGFSVDLSGMNEAQKSALEREAEQRGCSIPELLGFLVDERSREVLGKQKTKPI